MKRIFFAIFLLHLYSCAQNQTTSEHIPNPQAKKLNIQGIDHMVKAEYDQAVSFFDQAIALDPGFDMPHRNKFRVFIRQKAYEKALTEAEILVELYPNNFDWCMNRGMLLDKLGKRGDAQRDYSKVITMLEKDIDNLSEPGLAGTKIFIQGIMLKLAGQEEKGNTIIREMIEANPGNEQIKSFEGLSRKDCLEKFLDSQTYLE